MDETKKVGFGAAAYESGYGCSLPSPEGFCAMGSPRLALARALGCPFGPWIVPIKATFPDTNTPLVPEVGSDVKITQDTYVDAMVVRIMNEETPNASQFSTLSDFFFNYQSGIEVILDVLGAPRYSIVPKYTDISTVADMIGGAKWPCGWILSYTQQLMMSFRTTAPLPFAPLTVRVAFRTWVPIWNSFITMSNTEALTRLKDECGIDCGPGYERQFCR